MAHKDVTDPARMEKIVSLCKRRGFIFQAGELYGGLNGCWDYGPLGAELKRNLKDFWWRKTVQERDDMLGMDGAILTHQDVLKASGHVDSFNDPMSECPLTKVRLRADQVPAPQAVRCLQRRLHLVSEHPLCVGGRGPPLGQGRVALVHEVDDIRVQHARRERRRRARSRPRRRATPLAPA